MLSLSSSSATHWIFSSIACIDLASFYPYSSRPKSLDFGRALKSWVGKQIQSLKLVEKAVYFGVFALRFAPHTFLDHIHQVTRLDEPLRPHYCSTNAQLKLKYLWGLVHYKLQGPEYTSETVKGNHRCLS